MGEQNGKHKIVILPIKIQAKKNTFFLKYYIVWIALLMVNYLKKIEEI
jgi:hypothetical protein